CARSRAQLSRAAWVQIRSEGACLSSDAPPAAEPGERAAPGARRYDRARVAVLAERRGDVLVDLIQARERCGLVAAAPEVVVRAADVLEVDDVEACGPARADAAA